MKIDSTIRTCAIVGNSPSIIGKNYGKEIDSHDVVIRCNAGTTIGYERDVGHRTDYRLINIHIFHWVMNQGVREIESHLRNLDVQNVFSDGEVLILKDFSLKPEQEIDGEFKEHHAWGTIKQLHDIETKTFFMPKIALRKLNIWPHVSTGTYAAALARYLFPEAKIECYGFSFYEGATEESHYFENLEGKKLCHDFKRDFTEFQKIPNVWVK